MPETTTSVGAQDRMKGLLTCPKCGEGNAQGTRYCDNCGTSLSGVSAKMAGQAEGAKKGFFGRLFGRRS